MGRRSRDDLLPEQRLSRRRRRGRILELALPYAPGMRKSIDDALDDHPADDDERPPVSWAVALSDDCDACGIGELRLVLTVEESGRAGYGLVAHLGPDTA